jgi:TolB protein
MMSMKAGALRLFATFILQAAVAASCAAQDITISKRGADRFFLDFAGWQAKGSDESAAVFRNTLDSDLFRSGWFAPAERHADFRISGEVTVKEGELSVKCEAFRVSTGLRLLGKTYRAEVKSVRKLAHKASDDLTLALTGKPGMASARILMVGTLNGHKELYVCDADGSGLLRLTDDKSVSVGPKWGPKGDEFVYTSFLSRFPDVYLVDVASGRRKCIARYPGLNSSASLAPNGHSVALTLSKDGNPDIFVKNLSSGRLTRITAMRHSAQASPSWSPDGRRLVFVSDVSGSPQLYLVDSDGGAPRRITTRGSENVDPDWGANGLITYSSRVEGRYSICVINPDTGDFRQVSPRDADYDSPSWAPDFRHIACEKRAAYRSRVFIIDIMSDSCISLLPETISGEWYSPDFSDN